MMVTKKNESNLKLNEVHSKERDDISGKARLDQITGVMLAHLNKFSDYIYMGRRP